MPNPVIPFNRPHATGRELRYIQRAINSLHLAGQGPFDERCAAWLRKRIGCLRAFLTSSCTSALEMAVMLAGIGPGDEVIMPSFTFVTTAGSVALLGGVPLFVDIRPDTLNLNEDEVEAVITSRTKAILPVHYAGVGCEMDAITGLAEERRLTVIEDAAQGILSTYRERPLGSMGQLGCVSFHQTKNVTCGEGGALFVNVEEWIERAEIVQDKGTNRRQFLRGQVDKYSWVDLGSSFLTSEINAAFLCAQLESAEELTAARMCVWNAYHERFAALEEKGLVRRPVVPAHTQHNAHMYYLLLPDGERRDRLIGELASQRIEAVFHYVPLHSSRAGRRFGRADRRLPVTEDVSERLVRLPLWVGMDEVMVDRVVDRVTHAVGAVGAS
jgi:dTDP-4-amino-4,6-dideoxygalactose transaminase